ncbi:DNA-binding protein D-ETS-4 isoform X1 [Drosophila albomicans]|uniref:DNA-binding protein D-ETS-4 isoform X1 n=2 Tax=Drosophila albomicans TaxID=7291 RepID=A0A6P8XNR1_DROAB|nr:DNA-binding protein D-ETS-4 isoform X1 [Drosophila albomicans]
MEYEKMMYMPSAEMPHNSQFKLGAAVSTEQFQSQTTPEQQFAAYSYADNFDLSLLPEDAGIPTTVYQYNAPQIKIESAWDCASVGGDLHEQLATTNNSSSHQLIPPPPAYPHSAYPSPQSSPQQSDFASFAYGNKYNGSYDCLSSPCPSLDASSIKQELHILPPSPPESNCETPSPRSACSDGSSSIKAEPLDVDVENYIDLNSLLQQQQQQQEQLTETKPSHQLLRECLEDTTFQKKHNLKPLALESFIGGLAEVRGDFEPVISLALEHAKREADAICAELQISQDPNAWTSAQVHAWLRSTLAQFKLPPALNLELQFSEDGAALALLSEEEFMRRLPESGSTLHAQLEIWKMAYADQLGNNHATTAIENAQPSQNMWPTLDYPAQTSLEHEDSEDDDDMEVSVTPATVAATATATSTATPPKRTAGTRNGGGSHIHLWQFLKELLSAPQVNGTAIRWIDRSKGIFKIEDSVRVAKLWGRRKNRPAMNYDKLSRSIRQYYKKGIMKKTERSQRLVYQFCQPYHQ